ncbi:MAG TPA: short-chain dehydrogenase [Rhodospirillaceae bacterium]|nr:MAG: short-chain dehydrogenase [Alphaproteobacteria bacterium GWF2_58_20]HAU28788.1 short-chain dehydrogenase [Rhodospirillaceae bacterium]
MKNPKNILITGASSGIGKALALEYAAPGICLMLIARNDERLTDVADTCRNCGAMVECATLDVQDSDAMAAWIACQDDLHPIDLAIANAGISAGTAGGDESAEQARRIFSVNVEGTLNTLHPIIPSMAGRRRGQLALMASMAAFRGMPGAPAYSASKGAVRLYGEALRGELAPEGVEVSVICPGFVKSRITDANRFFMPLLMPAEKAAKRIRRGLEKNQARIAFPRRMYFFAWLMGALPPAWTDLLMARLPKKA